MAYVPSVTFRESPLGPWGASKSSSVQTGNLLPGTTPPAQKRPVEAIGCISNINAYISEAGLPRQKTLPPLILDSSKNLVKNKEEKLSDSEEDMSSKRGGKYTKRRTLKGEQPNDRSTVQEDKCADTQLVEMAAYPGYNPDKPTSLPHNLDTLEQMKRVTRAHAKLSTKARKFREAWCQLFYSQYSQEIFLDYYWWFFLHRYQPGHHITIQDSLFTRISDNYVKLLCQPIELKWRDTHFKMYPDAIAQCVYSTFICAYPNSWNNFDETFKNELSLCITLWQVGTRPQPGLWTKWNLKLLEPQNLLKNVGREKETESEKRSPQRLPAITSEQVQGNEGDDVETDGLVSSEFRRLSLDEVRKTLDGSTDTLIPLVRHNHRKQEEDEGGGVVPSVSEEKRISLARKQFQALEKRSRSQKELASQVKAQSDVALQPQEINHLESKSQLPAESEGINVLFGNLNASKQIVKQQHVGIHSKNSPSSQKIGSASKKFVQQSPRVETNLTVQQSPRLDSKPKSSLRLGNVSMNTVQPPCRIGSASKKIVQPSPRIERASKQSIQPSPRLGSASKKTIQPSPRLGHTTKGVQSSLRAGQTNLSRASSQNTQEKVTCLNSHLESKLQLHQSKRNAQQGKTPLSPADELINRAKAKIGTLQNVEANQTHSTVQQMRKPPQKIPSSVPTTSLNQAKHKSNTSRGTHVTCSAKYPGVPLGTPQKDVPPRGGPERPNIRTVPAEMTILQAKQISTTASQDLPQSKHAASEPHNGLVHANGQNITSQTCNTGSSKNAQVEAGTQAEGTAVPSKDAAAQTKNQQARSFTTTTAPPPKITPQKSKVNETSNSSPTSSKAVYQQACTELKEMALAFKQKTTEEILSSIRGPEFEHVLFNYHGHSPLVKHYISNTKRTHMNEKESIVGRTEIIEEQPEKAACYQDILAASKRSSEKNHTMFQRYYELQKQVLVASKKKRLDEHHKHEETVKLVLANRKEVQQLSNKLMLCAAQAKLQVSEAKTS